MFRYEVLMLAVPDITKDELATIESQIEKLVQQVKGSIISFDRWGKYRLAYPVKKNEYGVYCLARFDTPIADELLAEVRTLLGVKLEGSIMRYVITSLDTDTSLAYQRPLSLEEAPTKSASFLKEKGFINDDHGRRGRGIEETIDTDEQETEMA